MPAMTFSKESSLLEVPGLEACLVAAVTERSGRAWEGFKSARTLFCTLYCRPRSLPYSENYSVVQSWAPSTVTHVGTSFVSYGDSTFSLLKVIFCHFHFNSSLLVCWTPEETRAMFGAKTHGFKADFQMWSTN